MNPDAHTTPTFTCGARAVIRYAPHDWRVVCATCHGPIGDPWPIALRANLRAIETSVDPCPWCGEGAPAAQPTRSSGL